MDIEYGRFFYETKMGPVYMSDCIFLTFQKAMFRIEGNVISYDNIVNFRKRKDQWYLVYRVYENILCSPIFPESMDQKKIKDIMYESLVLMEKNGHVQL